MPDHINMHVQYSNGVIISSDSACSSKYSNTHSKSVNKWCA